MPRELRLDTGYVTIALTVPDEVTEDVLGSIGAEVTRLLPGGWRTGEAPLVDPDLRVAVASTERPSIRLAGECVLVGLPPPVLTSATLAYITYTAAERARQQRGLITTHACAVTTPEGQGVVLLGDKGSGKTDTALAMAAKGYPLCGDDLVVLATHPERLEVWAGKQVVAVRQPGVLFGYETKTAVHCGQFATPVVPVALVVRVGIHPSAQPTIVAGTPLSVTERLRLAENLARYITGTPTPLMLEPEVYAPVYPLDDPACATTRAAVIRQIADVGLCYLQAPSAQQAAGMIEELLCR
ncbi:MAG: hypothetical protein JO281_20045 [Pseudonocardiales bacterium]|nr:hypothetical protein [Pseudonocardiales bacterium]